MALFENFPYTNLQQLNLDWIIEQLNNISSSSVLSVNGQTGVVTLYQDADVAFPNVPEDHWSMIRMADGTLRGIMFGNDDKAYIVHGNLMAELYANNNPPPYPVTRVNGMYGDIELYTEQYVRLPDLTDAQMANWTFFRMLNNVSHGIQFNDDGTASIINGTSRYVLYTSQNPPPYPVDSVNGQTGTVVLFTDSNGSITYPAITDPALEAWSIDRNVNGTVLGIKIDENGYVTLKVGVNEYKVYTSFDPQELYVTDPTDEIQQVAEDSSNDFWGLMRETTEGSVGIMFENSDQDNPTAYIAYVDSNDQQQTLQLLTPNDIPSSGVISVNAKTGVVTLYGSDCDMSATDSRKIDTAVADACGGIAYYEPDDLVASQNYNTGDYIYWHYDNHVYVVTTPITLGDSLTPNVNISDVVNLGHALRSANVNITNLQNNKASKWNAGSHTLYSGVLCAGHITNAGTHLYFFYPVAVGASSSSSITFNSLTVRGSSDYVINNATDFTGYTLSAVIYENGICFNITLPTAYSSNNNTSITAMVSGSITLS